MIKNKFLRSWYRYSAYLRHSTLISELLYKMSRSCDSLITRMKFLIKLSLLLVLPCFAKAQRQFTNVDSLTSELKNAPDDTLKMVALFNLATYYGESNRDSCLFFADQGISIAKKINQPLWVAHFLTEYQSFVAMKNGNLPLSFKLANEALELVKDRKNENNVYIPNDYEFTDPHKFRLSQVGYTIHQLGNIYLHGGNTKKAIEQYKEEIRIFESLSSKQAMGLVQGTMNIGYIYGVDNKLDSALIYNNKALQYANLTGWKLYNGLILVHIADVFQKRNMPDSARFYFWQSLRESRDQKNKSTEVLGLMELATLYKSLHQADSLRYYATLAFQQSGILNSANEISRSANLVADAWKIYGNSDSAYTYLNLSKRISDSLNANGIEKLTQFQNIYFEEQLKLEKAAQEAETSSYKIRTIALIAGLVLLSALAFIFFKNNKQKQKANVVLQKTLSDLKSTQTQLIQSEKMASLGELTAGIAHEIQNPLNFVNNFSEVNNELIEEVKSQKSKLKNEELDELLNDIYQNNEKINQHGQRAADIVKGMLQHSRSSTGQKEPTDINALCEEYLKLAYHGLRAKDKSFNAKFETSFDESIGKVNIIPQDIGRVMLNLINNAFYAASLNPSKGGTLEPGVKKDPMIWVRTKREGHKVLISVKDNGPGIPDNIKDKIFQPFFTTKPTGQGTGLGLSLSYDIVKAHGGEIKVESADGAGTDFIVLLPG